MEFTFSERIGWPGQSGSNFRLFGAFVDDFMLRKCKFLLISAANAQDAESELKSLASGGDTYGPVELTSRLRGWLGQLVIANRAGPISCIFRNSPNGCDFVGTERLAINKAANSEKSGRRPQSLRRFACFVRRGNADGFEILFLEATDRGQAVAIIEAIIPDLLEIAGVAIGPNVCQLLGTLLNLHQTNAMAVSCAEILML